MKITVTFDVGDDYATHGQDPAAALETFRGDLQALLYDEGEGASRTALAGTFEIIATGAG